MTPKIIQTSLPTVVFLHGFGESSRTWNAVRSILGDDIFCIAPDLRGFGGNNAGDNGRTFDIADLADDVIGQLEAANATDVIVVGHSMGARVAMALAARQPARVRGLLLLAPSPPTPEPMDDAARATLRHAQADETSAANLIDSITAGRLSPDLRAIAIADVRAADSRAWKSWVDTGSRQDLSGLTIGIVCRANVLSGDHDNAIPTDIVRREVIGRLANARLTIVPGVGHLLPLEAPAVVAQAVRELLQQTTHLVPAAYASNRALLDTAVVTSATRRVLQERAAWRSTSPAFFTVDEYASLQAVCDTLIPQDDRGDGAAARTDNRYRVDIVGAIDRRLANATGDGWRFGDLPPDGEAYRRGLAAIDEIARSRNGVRFQELPAADRNTVIAGMRDGNHAVWRSNDLRSDRLLAEWLAEAVEIYYSHLGGGISDMRYVGFADGVGWREIGLNGRDAHERLPTTDTEVDRG